METIHSNSAASDSSQQLVDTLTSLYQWTVSSITYVKRRNHLSTKEKAGALKRLSQHEDYLAGLSEKYSKEVLPVDPEAIERLLEGQFSFNKHARYYEFPPYRLPEYINPAHNPKQLAYFHINGDIHIKRVFKGDNLLCEPVRFIADLVPNSLLVLFVRTNHRTPREMRLGLFSKVEGNNLWCRYDKPEKGFPGYEYKVKYSIFRVVHLYKVLTISRDAE